MAVLLLWALAFNLLQLFVYRRLGRCRRPKDPTDTIRHIVEVMLRDVATLPAPIPWATLLFNTRLRLRRSRAPVGGADAPAS